MSWEKLNKYSLGGAEIFLKEREPYCVGAASRFLGRQSHDHVWVLSRSRKKFNTMEACSALLIYSHRTLYPVFSPQNMQAEFSAVPLPPFFTLLQRSQPLHAMQGLAADMDLLKTSLDGKGFYTSVKIDYELRSLNLHGEESAFEQNNLPGSMAKVPAGLLIRTPTAADLDALFPLQQGYEMEEVLPPGAVFNPAACRRGLELLLKENMILAAELDGLLVGKININAQSFSRLQIGGVYVLPEWRSLGIATAMTTALIRKFYSWEKNFTLFVKKTNLPARTVYDNTGFTRIADYRINYYL
jgi:ribosomal protein S18 acetylase RimI-like enzyme